MLTQPLNATHATAPADCVQKATGRAAIYAALAAAFNDPTPDLAAQTLDGNSGRAIMQVAEVLTQQHIGADTLTAAQALQAALMSLDDEDAAALLHALKVDYAQLFLGPGFPSVSPYETIHTARDGDKAAPLMVSPQAQAVEAAYRDAGLALANAQRQPPDHFATELEFMYYLCTKEAEASAAGAAAVQSWRYRQDAFLEGHLARWSASFCDKVVQAARHPFYVAWARFAGVWIEIEKADRSEPA